MKTSSQESLSPRMYSGNMSTTHKHGHCDQKAQCVVIVILVSECEPSGCSFGLFMSWVWGWEWWRRIFNFTISPGLADLCEEASN